MKEEDMSKYQCLECNEASDTPFIGGQCSKCGSLNIRNLDHKRVKQPKESSSPQKILLMVILWGLIIYEIITLF